MDETECSCNVSKALNYMGYGRSEVTLRADFFDKYVRNVLVPRWKDWKDNIICAGSRAEGVADIMQCDNDSDMMTVMKLWTCTEVHNLQRLENLRNQIVLEMVTDGVAPGYTMLKCKEKDRESLERDFKKLDPVLKLDLQVKDGQTFLSHHVYKYKVHDDDVDLAGPAVNISQTINMVWTDPNKAEISDMINKTDFVQTIECTGMSHLLRWKQRERLCDWPEQQLIEEISQMKGHVVPVGIKSSDSDHLEWRICFTEAEIKLIRSLHDVMLKVYILLKKVAKLLLKPVCANMTSYIIKNVVLWTAEETPKEKLNSENLLEILMKALSFLHGSVRTGHLKNYMIAERDLLFEKITQEEKEKLIVVLDKAIHSKGHVFVMNFKTEFQELNVAMEEVNSNPQKTKDEISRRDVLLKLLVRLWEGPKFTDMIRGLVDAALKQAREKESFDLLKAIKSEPSKKRSEFILEVASLLVQDGLLHLLSLPKDYLQSFAEVFKHLIGINLTIDVANDLLKEIVNPSENVVSEPDLD